MSKLFDKLDDETPPSQGQEIGQVLSTALTEVSKSNEQIAQVLAQSIKDALSAVDSKTQSVEPKTSVKRWIFKVIRDKDGLMDNVIATAEFE